MNKKLSSAQVDCMHAADAQRKNPLFMRRNWSRFVLIIEVLALQNVKRPTGISHCCIPAYL